MKLQAPMALSLGFSVFVRGVELPDFKNALLARLAIILALGVIFGFEAKVESQEDEIQYGTLILERRIGTITRDVINVRSCSSTSCGITQKLYKGDEEYVLGEEEGQSIQGVSLWYEIESGYVWSELMSVSFTHTCPDPEEGQSVTISEATGLEDDPHLYCSAGAVANDLWAAVWDYRWRDQSGSIENMFARGGKILEIELYAWCISQTSPTCDLYKSSYLVLGDDFVAEFPAFINNPISEKIRSGDDKPTPVTLNFHVDGDTIGAESLVLYTSTFDGSAFFNIGYREPPPEVEQEATQE